MITICSALIPAIWTSVLSRLMESQFPLVSLSWKGHRLFTPTQYDVKPKHPVMGSALHIPLPKGLKIGSSVSTKITYKTTAECTALQWLDKEYVMNFILDNLTELDSQTQGKQFPYLFSQCQPIYARSLAPLQGQFFSFIYASSILIFFLLSDTSSSKIVRWSVILATICRLTHFFFSSLRHSRRPSHQPFLFYSLQ